MLKKNILITGASKGIGKALTIKFAEEGHIVFAASRNIEIVSEYAEVNKLTSNILPQKLDVTDREAIIEMMEKLEKTNPIYCVINNAGITSFRKAEHDTFGMIEDIVNTNLLGAVNLIKASLPGMIERKSGAIINIISVAADKVFTNSSIYAASKIGLQTYSKVLREELREHNIQVINVLPGATKTDIWSEEMRDKFGDRMMTPEDIADVVYNAFKMSDKLVQEEIILRPILGDL